MFQNLINGKYVKSGGYATFGYLSVSYVSLLASRFNVSANIVSKIWEKFCNERRNIDPSPKGRNRSSKFSDRTASG